MLKIKSITAKNFLSIGAVTQSVNLDRDDLTLVIGENLDLGGVDSGSKNGVGKSAMLNAISYALYGQALTNIRKDNLINKSNGKNSNGFFALPCGIRLENGRFSSGGQVGAWWSATVQDTNIAKSFQILFPEAVSELIGAGIFKIYKGEGLSVRCIKD
jgi:hypothetical protein